MHEPDARDRPAAEGSGRLRLELVGVGAMSSPRYLPAGLLLRHPAGDVMLDGGPGAEPQSPVRRWLVTDLRSELVGTLRTLARARGIEIVVEPYRAVDLVVTPHPVRHTNHPTWGFLIEHAGRTAVWAPEFWEFPLWAGGADLMFADAAAWQWPIRFRGGVGGHAAVLDTAEQARRLGVGRLVFAHIGRPTIRALDAGLQPPYGELGREGATYLL